MPLVRFNQNLMQTGNTFTGTANQLGFYTYYRETPSCSVPITNMWQTFASTFSSQSNTWGDTVATNSNFPFFQAAILNGTVPLSTWQSPPPQGVGQDTNSQFLPKAPSPQQCARPQTGYCRFLAAAWTPGRRRRDRSTSWRASHQSASQSFLSGLHWKRFARF